MINLKKIVTALASVAMVGSTLGFAAAAAYPSPFAENGAGDVGIVYGSNDDFTAATNIGTNLAGSITTGVNAPTGESVLFEKSSTKLILGRSLLEVSATAVDDDNPGDGLPTLLAEGTYTDDDNDEFDFTQKVELGVLNLTMWEDNEYAEDTPTVGIRIADNIHVLNYTLDFTDTPEWADLTTTDINIMGKSYFILSVATNQTMNLLDAAQRTVLAEGESTSLVVEGVTYDISLDFVSSSAARFTVNGQQTNSLSAGDTQRVAGAYIGVKSVDAQDYAGGVKNVEFSLGSGKLELGHNKDIKINDVAVNDLKAFFSTQDGTTAIANGKISKVVIEWNADDDLFVTESSEVTMPGFEAIKLTYTGMTYPTEEVITVAKSSDSTIMLADFPLKDSIENIYLISRGTGSGTGDYAQNGSVIIGKEIDNLLLTSNNTQMLFNDTIHDYFVASWDDTNEAESYLMRVTNFDVKSASAGTDKVTFQYKKDGNWIDAKIASNDEVVTIGNVELIVSNVSEDHSWVNFTSGDNVAFNTIYSKEGMKMWLPWSNHTGNSTINGDGTTSSFTPADLLTTPGYVVANDTNPLVVLTFQEEDNNENPAGGHSINVTLGFNSASTPEVSVTAIAAGHQGTFREKGDTDVYRNFVYSALGTEMLWAKPSGGQYSVELIYHGGESYGSVYLTAPNGAAGGATGVVPVMDTAVSGVQSKNLIVVGGSCVNTVAAKLLGSDVPLCDADWTAKTGTGSGEYLIATYPNPYAADKIAVLVAGYAKADTASAGSYLTSNLPDVATVGTRIEGP